MFPTTVEHQYHQRNRRRGRNDPNNRDYICPCGKSYLSYPALFTHIKTKHNGRVSCFIYLRLQDKLLNLNQRIVGEVDLKQGRCTTVRAKLKILPPILLIEFAILCCQLNQKNLRKAFV